MNPRSDTPRLLATLALGALVFAAGLAAARAWLPEWRARALPSPGQIAASYRALAERLGVHAVGGWPSFDITTADTDDPGWIACVPRPPRSPFSPLCTELRIEASQRVVEAGQAQPQELEIGFTAGGAPHLVRWGRAASEALTTPSPGAVPQPRVETLLRLLREPGEPLGAPQPLTVLGNPGFAYPLPAGAPPQHLLAFVPLSGQALLERRPGGPEVSVADSRRTSFSSLFLRLAQEVFPILAVGALFLVLLSRRRIDMVNAAALSVFSLLAAVPALLVQAGSLTGALGSLLGPFWRALWVFLVWSTGESLLRTADPGFTTSLDALRAGRLGPRGGRALLTGLGLGAGLAGLALGVYAAATALPGTWPGKASLHIPVFGRLSTPFSDGMALAGCIVLLLAVARRIAPARWAPVLAVAVGAFLFGPVEIHPFPAALAANALLLAALVAIGAGAGLTALLTAAIAFFLLPGAAFSGLHLDWLPGTFAATAGTSAGLLLLGLVGLARPAQVEAQRLRAPAFMRRIEEERRIRYEMDLLARMQEGLLPRQLPVLPGWELAARSVLATEAGGDLYDFLVDDAGHLWVAAGDVAGHGYSCAIVQAMTTAALTSLIAPERTPSEVLARVDRVIRRGGSPRNFTSLALLRLDPATGAVLLSNAGHPFPLLVEGGEATEIPVPGLPLGQGPARQYRDHLFQLPVGGALVFCSDGLIEAQDARDQTYGFDRPRDVIRDAWAAGRRRAGDLLESLLADWRRHLGREEPPDDTTIVVLRRLYRP